MNIIKLAQVGGITPGDESGSGGDPTTFQNPLAGGEVNTVAELVVRLIQWMLGIAGTLALLAIIVGGVYYILSFGNDQAMSKAKSTILWAIAGLVVIALAYVIINTVSTVLGVL